MIKALKFFIVGGKT